MSNASRAAAERASSGWSWENNPRQRARLTAQVLATYGTVCHLCRTEGATTADHLIPRTAGGPNTLANCRPAHRDCNVKRGSMPLTIWFAKYPVPRATALAPSREW